MAEKRQTKEKGEETMKVAYKVNDNVTFDVEAKGIKEAFEFLSYADSVFGVKECGNCGSENLRFEHRTTEEGWNYYSIKCLDCGHELKFGQTQVGNKLFPKGWSEPYNGGNKRAKDEGADEAPFDGGQEDEGYDEKPKSRGRAKAGAGASKGDSDIDW